MAYFARQKRQTKTYWAELGFMALGLFGLQPGLFTNLLSAPQPSLSELAGPIYASYPFRPQSNYLDYSSTPSLTLASNLYGTNAVSWAQPQYLSNSFLPAINTLPPSYLATQYPQSANVSQLSTYPQQPLYSQAAYAPAFSALGYPQQNSNQLGYSQPSNTSQNTFQPALSSYNQPTNQAGYGYGQQIYSQQPYSQQPYSQAAGNWSNANPQSQNFASQSTYQPNQQQAQPSYQQNQKTWPNVASYLAQANPTPYAQSSVSGQYGNNGGNYRSNSAFQSNNNAGSRTSPYNAYEPFTAKPSMFSNGTDSPPYSSNNYYAGSNYGAASAQSYPYQAANNGSGQRYRTPASQLYR
jgi:hypothetical protein